MSDPRTPAGQAPILHGFRSGASHSRNRVPLLRPAPAATIAAVPLGPTDILLLVAIGLCAGAVGGLLGIGGSIIMIPAMAIAFAAEPFHNQHLYQAAAMAANVAVALPAARRHRRAGALRRDVFRIMLPAALVAIIAGVLLSNALATPTLKRLFALFLLYVVVTNTVKLVRRRPEHEPHHRRVNWFTGGTVGGVMGFVAGLLGIGGGGIAVPLANTVCRIPLREAIAASANVMVLTAAVGAALKIATLPERGASIVTALIIAACLAPTAILGGHLGAGLTHRLPIPWIRGVFTLAIAAAAARMAGLF